MLITTTMTFFRWIRYGWEVPVGRSSFRGDRLLLPSSTSVYFHARQLPSKVVRRRLFRWRSAIVQFTPDDEPGSRPTQKADSTSRQKKRKKPKKNAAE